MELKVLYFSPRDLENPPVRYYSPTPRGICLTEQDLSAYVVHRYPSAVSLEALLFAFVCVACLCTVYVCKVCLI